MRCWLSQLYGARKEFRDAVQAKNGNALADFASEQVETWSKQKGKAWHRSGPKRDESAKDDKAGKKGDAARKALEMIVKEARQIALDEAAQE